MANSSLKSWIFLDFQVPRTFIRHAPHPARSLFFINMHPSSPNIDLFWRPPARRVASGGVDRADLFKIASFRIALVAQGAWGFSVCCLRAFYCGHNSLFPGLPFCVSLVAYRVSRYITVFIVLSCCCIFLLACYHLAWPLSHFVCVGISPYMVVMCLWFRLFRFAWPLSHIVRVGLLFVSCLYTLIRYIRFRGLISRGPCRISCVWVFSCFLAFHLGQFCLSMHYILRGPCRTQCTWEYCHTSHAISIGVGSSR